MKEQIECINAAPAKEQQLQALAKHLVNERMLHPQIGEDCFSREALKWSQIPGIARAGHRPEEIPDLMARNILTQNHINLLKLRCLLYNDLLWDAAIYSCKGKSGAPAFRKALMTAFLHRAAELHPDLKDTVLSLLADLTQGTAPESLPIVHAYL